MRLKIYVFLIIIVFILNSCSSNTINPLSDDAKKSHATAELKAAIANSPFFSDEGQGDSSSTKTSTSAVFIPQTIDFTFQGWYRAFQWENISRTITITDLDIVNGTASVEVTANISGILNVGDSWWGVITGSIAVQKNFTHYIKRKATFKRVNNVWQIQSISPSYSSSSPIGLSHGIDIEYVKIYNSADVEIFSITDVDTLYNRDTLPHLSPNTSIKIQVKVKNNIANNTNYCYYHQHILSRKPLYDDGTSSGDATADDDIYTGTYNTIVFSGIFNAYFDILSQKTLSKDDSTTYKSVVWGIPYIVE